jgi:MFS family permease
LGVSVALVGFMDELWSGVAVSAAPAVEREQGLGHAGYALTVFAAPMVFSAVVEAALVLLSDRVARRRFIAAGLLVLGGSLAICAFARTPWLLSAGLALSGAASGTACGAAQAELIDEHGGLADRAMARFTVFAAAGDLVSPLMVGAALAFSFSYRSVLFTIAALIVVQGIAVGRGRPLAHPRAIEEEARSSLRESVARAARHPRLWLWLFGAGMCTLLDEVIVALVALRFRLDLGATEARAATCVVCFTLGSLAGALATDRLIAHVPARRLMLASAALCAGSVMLVLCAPSLLFASAALVLVGAFAAPQYPLAKASAYAVMPDSPGVVNALGQVFVVLDLAAPVALGALADRCGLEAALACLLAQPLTIFVLAAVVRR